MSSALRRQQRRIARARSDYEPKTRAFRHHKDGSYDVLRPTKGWLHVSAARLRAQFRIHQMREATASRKA